MFIMRFILVFMLLIGVSIQTASQVIKYKAYKYTTFKHDDKHAEDKTWLETNLVVVFNIGEDVIKIYGAKEHSFSLIKSLNCIPPDDDKFCVDYNAIDDDGEKMKLSIITSKTKNSEGKTLGVLSLSYTKGVTMYLMKTQ